MVYLAMFTISILFGCSTSLVVILTWIKKHQKVNRPPHELGKLTYKAYFGTTLLYRRLLPLGVPKVFLDESNFSELLTKQGYRAAIWLYALLYFPAAIVGLFTLITSVMYPESLLTKYGSLFALLMTCLIYIHLVSQSISLINRLQLTLL